jgi:hypothetical protein
MRDSQPNYGRSPDLSPKPFSGYSCKDIVVSGGLTNYSLKEHTDLFDTVTGPIQILIRNGAESITVRFNSVDNDPIPLLGDVDWGVDGLIVMDIFVTVSGSSDATMNIYTQGWR